MTITTEKVLVDHLISFESHQSPFECAIRGIELPVIAEFERDGRLSCPDFKMTDRVVEADGAERTRTAFPNISRLTGNHVLTAVQSDVAPKGKRVAVLFSGGPAAGGHNVVAGIRRILGPDNTLFGIKAGPLGLMLGDCFEIGLSDVDGILNTGGFDFLGSDRTKIKTAEDMARVLATVQKFKLDGIIVVGGDDSNTNAAFIADYLAPHDCAVIGVPKTIDGDLQVGDLVPISFGFDTATKIYSEIVGNILQDTPSSRKYWHFIKLMGRSASHVALEVALQTHPAVTLISEEIAARNMTLSQVVEQIAEAVVARAASGINHGVVLIPEGVIEFIPEIKALVRVSNEFMAGDDVPTASMAARVQRFGNHLNSDMKILFAGLPESIQTKLLMDRDSHGNLQVSQIPSEELFIELTEKRVAELDPAVKFAPLNHFFGYEGRCGAPTRFDAVYTYNLGLVAGALVVRGKSGYMAGVSDIASGGKGVAIPLSGLITTERRSGGDHMVIKKALVEMESPAFKFFESRREAWARSDVFSSPGPRQLWGPLGNQVPMTVALNLGAESLGFLIGR